MSEKQYNVIITPFAENSLQQIDDYLRQDAWFQETVDDWEHQMEEQLQSLSSFPASHSLVKKEPWRGENIRFYPYKGYNIYFWINETDKEVFITDVVHQRMNQDKRIFESMMAFYRNYSKYTNDL